MRLKEDQDSSRMAAKEDEGKCLSSLFLVCFGVFLFGVVCFGFFYVWGGWVVVACCWVFFFLFFLNRALSTPLS